MFRVGPFSVFLIRCSSLVRVTKRMTFVRNNSCDADAGDDDQNAAGQFFASLKKVQPSVPTNKITVVGTGQVGMACAVSCLTRGITSDLCLFDADKKRMKGETMDLQHGSLFLRGARIVGAESFSDTAHSKCIIVTAGARQKEGETRPDLMGRNVDILKSFIPELVKQSPDCILIIVSNPVDAMTYLAWKLSGLPQHRVMGSGTSLDSSRFCHFIAERLNASVNDTVGWIIGEHGDTSVPAWSSVSVAGVLLRSQYPKAGKSDDPDNWNQLHKLVVDSAYDVIALKGYTSWAIGFGVGQIAEVVLANRRSILAVSSNLNGFYGIKDDVFGSIPCVVGGSGVMSQLKLPLDDEEKSNFKKSLQSIQSLFKDINL